MENSALKPWALAFIWLHLEMHHPSRATTMFMAMARPNKSGPPSRIMPPATSQKLLRSRPKMWQKAQDVNPALKFLRSQSDRVSVGCAGTHQIHGSPIIDRLGSDLFEARTKDRTWGCPLVSGTKVLVVVPWVLWVASWGHPLQDLFRHIQWRVDQIGIRGIWKAMLTHWALHHITWAIPEYLVWECPARGAGAIVECQCRDGCTKCLDGYYMSSTWMPGPKVPQQNIWFGWGDHSLHQQSDLLDEGSWYKACPWMPVSSFLLLPACTDVKLPIPSRNNSNLQASNLHPEIGKLLLYFCLSVLKKKFF